MKDLNEKMKEDIKKDMLLEEVRVWKLIWEDSSWYCGIKFTILYSNGTWERYKFISDLTQYEIKEILNLKSIKKYFYNGIYFYDMTKDEFLDYINEKIRIEKIA